MAEIIHSSSFCVRAKVAFDSSSEVKFERGRVVETCPALFDVNGDYIVPVNLWFIYLITEKHCQNINSYWRAILSFWNFLEENAIPWDHFPRGNLNKPTYRYRSEILIPRIKSGELAASTANTYISHVVNFYKWAIHDRFVHIRSEKYAPFKMEYITIENQSMLGHIQRYIRVNTTDLRIKVPKKTRDQRLSPLLESELNILAQELQSESIEFGLIINLQIRSGLRIAEACSFPDSLIRMPMYDEVSCKVDISIGTGMCIKYDKPRSIEIDANLIRKLYQYKISQRRQHRLEKYSGLQTPLFISQRGGAINPSNIEVQWSKLRKRIQNKYNLPFRHKTHDNRSTFATYLLEALLNTDEIPPGEALKIVMLRMGHESESTTWEYLAWLKERDVRRNMLSTLDTIMDSALDEVQTI